MGNDGLWLLQLTVHLQQVHLNLVVGQFAQQHQAFRHVELTKHLSACLEESRLTAFQRSTLVVDLSGTVVSNAVTLGDDEVLPALL